MVGFTIGHIRTAHHLKYIAQEFGTREFHYCRTFKLNYLQNKTSRLEYHIRRTYRKCKNKITMFKILKHCYFIFTLSIRASNVILET